MTLEALFTLFVTYKPMVLLILLFAPWLALGLCIAIPGKGEEPLILSFNLGMACISLLVAIAYLMYATHQGGWAKIIQEADILLILAPCYYVAVSFWVTKQRLPLNQVPAVRAIQAIALIVAGYLAVGWFLSKIRFLVLTFLPFPLLLLLFLSLVSIIYFGYLRLTGKDLLGSNQPNSSRHSAASPKPAPKSIDSELERLRRQINDSNE